MRTPSNRLSPSRVKGTIESIDRDVLSVKARRGDDVKLHMISDIRVVGITKILLSDIKVGSFIGATTVPGPDGMPRAVEVHVFSEDMRGTGEEATNARCGSRASFQVGQCMWWMSAIWATDIVSGWSNEIAAAASCCRSQTVKNNLTRAEMRTRFRLAVNLGIECSPSRTNGSFEAA
jgi:hypothetical protein